MNGAIESPLMSFESRVSFIRIDDSTMLMLVVLVPYRFLYMSAWQDYCKVANLSLSSLLLHMQH